MDIIKNPREKHASVVANLLNQNDYVFVSGKQMTSMLSTNVDEVVRFMSCWGQLERDRYMADGGGYRYRRYGQFNKLKNTRQLVMLPHEPYVQPASVNPLNGDVERHFEPLTDRFTLSPILEKLLLMMSDIYDAAQGEGTDWNIRLHPYRIIADELEQGKPTPEGLHRDGVTYIASMLISRTNITGGETVITDDKRNVLERLTLEKTFDMVMADDLATMHEVSAISPICNDKCAYRDVLVIAFTKMEE
ncbi:2OG-Fe dioxygenase family protein [Vibrio sinaloensis]|uniref:2OG-Fe dioxygenase family protein n=1 Tax=Photobacterium sp. (strain ATCC 43367) TaxID=379097 RepID=UPI00205AFE72|nr:2OG-Fe dioxygenase family protein [Vibrio sinaloensis]UPQ89514.1 2OG-Fe dioxygenase family protein [Vibrio sinaloensis]